MKRNWINPLTDFPFNKRYYLTHPWKFFNDCWSNLKNAKMRIIRGWCWSDLWNMDNYLMEIIPDMLRTLASDGQTYPGREPFETPEKWHSWLYYAADELDSCKEENYEKKNEYYEAYIKRLKDWKLNAETAEEDKKYFTRDIELHKEAIAKRTKILSEIIKYFDWLWD